MSMSKTLKFQGNLSKKSYFEGWYYKQVSYDENHSLSLIPGISTHEGDPHSFIQYIYNQKQNGTYITKSGYIRFALDQFIWNDYPFTLKIGDNLFSEELVSIHLEDDTIKLEGILQLGTFTKIKRTLLNPSIMGPFSYLPKMTCYHDVISMSHLVNGDMKIDGSMVAFTGGKGYIEKDWGTIFPKHYTWLQCNHFSNPTTSFFFSDAHIPLYGKEFQGWIASFFYNNEEYRFATYTKSERKIDLQNNKKLSITLENDLVKITVIAVVEEEAVLLAPVSAGMQKPIHEATAVDMSLTFYNKKTKEKYTDVSKLANLEIVTE